MKSIGFFQRFLLCVVCIALFLFVLLGLASTVRSETQAPNPTPDPAQTETPVPTPTPTPTPPPRLEDNRNWVQMILRARQLKEVYWYALTEIVGGHAPGGTPIGNFHAGFGYFGVPYAMGSRYVSSSRAFGMFLEETKDIDSPFYQTRSTADNYIAPSWGADCSSFVSYAWGLTGRFTTLTLVTTTGGRVRTVVRRGEGSIAELADLNQICPGDALIYRMNPNGHVRLVVSVTREGNADPFDIDVPIIGVIVWEQINMTASTFIAVTTYGEGGLQPLGNAEPSGDFGARGSLADLLDDIQNGTEDPLDDYGIYRLKDFNGGRNIIRYTPSPYVPLSLEEALVGEPFLGTPRLLGNRTERGVFFAATLNAVPRGGEEIHFILERSEDKKTWETVAQESRKTPAGIGLMPLSCLLIDESADPALLYHYRVRAEFKPILLDWGSEEQPRGMAVSYTQYSTWSAVLFIAAD
ncbi:MAG: hypothetical protein FWF10_07000 [Clostridiales bacterium]|nr:hypothetical protein [Clostridiales bacterium]